MNTSFVYRNISLLYRSLEEIQKNMGFVSRRGNTFLDNRRVNTSDRVYTINADQRFMIETYKEMYNTILHHIEFLYSQLGHTPQQYNPNYQNQNQNQNQRHNNLFYFDGQHYYTIDANPININNVAHPPPPPPLVPNQIPNYNIQPPPIRYAVPPPPAPIQRPPIIRTTQRTLSTPMATFARSMGNFNDPVNVVATPQQISTATTNLLYENIETPLNDRCPICLEVFQSNSEVTQINQCRHLFNRSQLATWFQTNVRCPVCRFDIRDHANTPPPSSDTAPALAPEPAFASVSAPPAPPTPPAPADVAHADAASMSTLNNHLTEMLDTFANQAFQNMFEDNVTSEILANLFNNNIENLTFDPSANAFTFNTFISGRP
jgi:hypothetical protein